MSHKSNETPHRVFISLYLYHFYTKEKREEQPHLLSRFSPALGFLSHILCLFVDGVCIYFCFLFFAFELFHTILF
jgi:hypothetical protein